MNDRYNRSAYKRTVWKEAARLLREMYFPETGPRPELFCDEVFRAPRVVPQEIIQEIIVILHKAERSEEESMTKFRMEEMRDDEVRSLTESAEGVREGKRKAAPPRPKRHGRKAAEGA
jgi:hypothetical protein